MRRLSNDLELAEFVGMFTLEAWAVFFEEGSKRFWSAEVYNEIEVRLHEYGP
jgi:hypothetical protein